MVIVETQKTEGNAIEYMGWTCSPCISQKLNRTSKIETIPSYTEVATAHVLQNCLIRETISNWGQLF